MAHVYILECSDGSYYVGSTNNLPARLHQHTEGYGAAYTRRRRPVRLVFNQEYASVADAYTVEKQIQVWGRSKREALIRGDFDLLPDLAKKRFDRG